MEFFRIFELLVILAIIWLIWRFLKADFSLAKKKVDAILTEDEQKGETNAKSTKSKK